MTKLYNTPMLQIISIQRNDIVTASGDKLGVSNTLYEGTTILAPDRFNEWYEGY